MRLIVRFSVICHYLHVKYEFLDKSYLLISQSRKTRYDCGMILGTHWLSSVTQIYKINLIMMASLQTDQIYQAYIFAFRSLNTSARMKADRRLTRRKQIPKQISIFTQSRKTSVFWIIRYYMKNKLIKIKHIKSCHWRLLCYPHNSNLNTITYIRRCFDDRQAYKV